MGIEESDLIDSLVRPRIPELVRPIGGEEEEWDPGVVGLGHGGQEVDDGGPRCRYERDRAPRRLGETECEEGGGALIDMRPDLEFRVSGAGESERRRA